MIFLFAKDLKKIVYTVYKTISIVYFVINMYYIMSAHINTNNGNSNNYKEQQQEKLGQQYHLLMEESFNKKAKQFIRKTENHALQGLNPGGYYQAIWCRDASFILKTWFHSGNFHGLLQQISTIWSHQIESGKEKIVYGQGVT